MHHVMLVAVAVDLATHPLLFSASARMTALPPLLLAEGLVVGVEALLAAWLPRVRDLPVVALTALLANLVSVGAGLVVAGST